MRDAANVCVIPARGGSKRIPRKNVALFHGRPMLAWSVETARSSGLFERVCVSTDDPEIARVALAEGAEVPFVRPEALSGDTAGTVAVIAHAVSALGLAPETAVCCLYATAPMVQADDLRAARARLEGATYVASITRYPHPIQRALRLAADGGVEMMAKEHLATRSQDLEEAWHDAGQFYWGRSETWVRGVPVWGPGARGVPLPRHRAADIDTPEDWALAELLFEAARR